MSDGQFRETVRHADQGGGVGSNIIFGRMTGDIIRSGLASFQPHSIDNSGGLGGPTGSAFDIVDPEQIEPGFKIVAGTSATVLKRNPVGVLLGYDCVGKAPI